MSYVTLGQYEKLQFYQPAIQATIRAAEGLAPEQKGAIEQAAAWLPVARTAAPTVGKFMLIGAGFFLAWWIVGCKRR